MRGGTVFQARTGFGVRILGVNPGSATILLCDLSQVPAPVWALFFASVKGLDWNALRKPCLF